MSKITQPKTIRVEGAGGVGINVFDHGGDGPNLLLAHCTGTHARVWDPMIPALTPHFHVYALDARGHGDSDKPENAEAYRWALSGDDMLAVIDALDLEPGLRAVGHSAGGAHICHASWKRPDAFDRVVLIDPIVGPPEAFAGDNPLAEKARKRKDNFLNREQVLERWSNRPPLNAWDPEVLWSYVEYGFRDTADGGIKLKCPGPIEAMVYEGSGASDVYEHLNELPLKTLLLTSDTSNVRHLAELQKNRFRDVRYAVVEGASHFIPQEKPREVTRLILDWMR